MTQLYIFNSYSNKKETFTPINKESIGFYVCGPTVYSRPHIGNARSAVIFDLLYRVLKHLYTKVTYVRNITDVDDKIILAAQKNNESTSDLAKRIEKYYQEDIGALNCLPPIHEPKATEHITDMINMIESLIQKGNAYAANSHVLFSVKSFSEYGKLSNRTLEEMVAGARVEVADYKEDPMDFVLWKPAKDGEIGFESPWGYGRPGWHIECSAMAKKYLGNKFDIHGGGVDLLFPHHENEIAQSYCANNCNLMANYWVHNGFLTISGEKMSKSLGNISTIHEMLEKGYDMRVLRYFFLSSHYRKPLDLNDKALNDAQKAIDKFTEISKENYNTDAQVDEGVLQALCDDLNTPLAISKLHEMATSINKGDKSKLNTFIASLNILGLGFKSNVVSEEIPEQVRALAENRVLARGNKDWQKSDELREQIAQLGYSIKDSASGYKLTKI